MEPADPVERLRTVLTHVEDADAGAAVAVLLRRGAGGLQLLLVRRAVNPSDPWSGDMAFPGGRRRPEDGSLWETAVRETMEEAGVDLRVHRLLGAMGVATSSIAPELGVLPFVVLCEEAPQVSLGEELCSHLWVPLDRLRRSMARPRPDRGEVPAYVVDGVVVWGLTYRIAENLLQLLGAPG